MISKLNVSYNDIHVIRYGFVVTFSFTQFVLTAVLVRIIEWLRSGWFYPQAKLVLYFRTTCGSNPQGIVVYRSPVNTAFVRMRLSHHG